MSLKEKLEQVGTCEWELPRRAVSGMRVPTRLFLSEKLIKGVENKALRQAANVATLPGIQKWSIALPDMHMGYGFPIGGVAALDALEGGLSPGGIGFDINCGVRLLRTNLYERDVKPQIKKLVQQLYRNVPAGVGRRGKIRLSPSKLRDKVLPQGAKWAVENGYGKKADLEHLEESGKMSQAKPQAISKKALLRGCGQLGTLGAGNHFLEIQQVSEIYDQELAKKFGIQEKKQVCIMIHTGSRGFGHQVCKDYIGRLNSSFKSLVRKLPDKQLVYAPAGSKEQQEYFGAMACAVNFAFCNRQLITHWVREAIMNVLGMSEEEIGLEIVYGVAHNIAKFEKHEIDGKTKKVFVHRKGATRAFGPGRDIPSDYRKIGQPVLIPGTMGTSSYVLVGTEKAEEKTFSSVCHGAGRKMSRHAADRRWRGKTIKKNLEDKGIHARSASWRVMAEEASEAYHDIDEVVDTCARAGISRKVARFRPLGVVKG